MKASKARRMAMLSCEEALRRGGTKKGDLAASVSLSFALLELAHQVGRLADSMPVYGPPEEQ